MSSRHENSYSSYDKIRVIAPLTNFSGRWSAAYEDEHGHPYLGGANVSERQRRRYSLAFIAVHCSLHWNEPHRSLTEFHFTEAIDCLSLEQQSSPGLSKEQLLRSPHEYWSYRHAPDRAPTILENRTAGILSCAVDPGEIKLEPKKDVPSKRVTNSGPEAQQDSIKPAPEAVASVLLV